MSERLLSVDSADGATTVRLDDGAVNAFSVPMLEALHGAIDQAESEGSLLVITGREGTLSAGFDLKTIGTQTNEMLGLGARLAERLFSFPRPVIIACTGHAIAMGGFLVLSGDFRIGAAGAYRIGLNEVQIGLTVPRFGVALAGYRLNPAWHDRVLLGGQFLSPDDAAAAGFFDQVVPGAELEEATAAAVATYAGINEQAHTGTKLRARAAALEAMREGLEPGADGTW